MNLSTSNSEPPRARVRPFRRYVKHTLGFLAVGLAVVAGPNVIVDPTGVFGFALPLPGHEALHPHRSALHQRPYKAEMLGHRSWDVLLVGSSRVVLGLDPAHPRFAGRRALNVGIAGTSMQEMKLVFDRILENQKPELVIWMADEFFFNRYRRLSPWVSSSRFDPDLDPWTYYGTLAFGKDTINFTLETLGNARAGRPSLASDLGFRSRPKQQENWNYVQRLTRPVLTPGHRLHVRESSVAFSLQRLAEFVEICRRCQERGIELKVVTAPLHALVMARLRQDSFSPAFFGKVKRACVGAIDRLNAAAPQRPAIEFWDFHGHGKALTYALPQDREQAEQARPYHWDP
ncbi:MAG: hypothetical protein OER86_08330, partial [Phycisphaerae bacterium]|nr:hypothetical protein [Phycisphaerae bacterium]